MMVLVVVIECGMMMVMQMGERVTAVRLQRLQRRCTAKVDQRRTVVGKVAQLRRGGQKRTCYLLLF